MKSSLFKLIKNRHFYSRMIILLVCIFISLQYLHGEIYAQCKSIYPDEIIDLTCSIFPFLSEKEQTICSKSRDDKQFISSVEIQVSSTYSGYLAEACFFLECLHPQVFKKGLSILQRYNSWSSISGLSHFLISTITIFFILFINKESREEGIALKQLIKV